MAWPPPFTVPGRNASRGSDRQAPATRTGLSANAAVTLWRGLDVVLTVLGAAIVVYGLSDIFLTLVHPHARGRLTRGIVAGIWRATSRGGRRARAASGPLAAISVVLAWAAIQAIGWAFIYLPHVPDGFSYSEGIDPDLYADALEALYFSLVSLSTLGFGEVVPIDPFVRLLVTRASGDGIRAAHRRG